MGKWTRRALLASGGLVGGGLLLGAGWFTFAPNRLAGRPESDSADAQITTWVKIAPDGVITVIAPHAELGQGSQTALAMMLAEELEADWTQVRVEEAPAISGYANGHILRGFFAGAFDVPQVLVRGFEYSAFKLTQVMDFQLTGGSVSIRGTGQYGMRVAGAAARELLIEAAADKWSVPESECVARLSSVTHTPSGRSFGYGELASDAALLDPPMHPTLKSPADFTIIGTSRRRFDLPSKTDGSAIFSVDVRLPDMLHAAVRAAPVFGDLLESVDAEVAESMPGVRRVVQLERAVVVVADSYWQALRAVNALDPRFSDSGHRAMSSESWYAAQAEALSGEKAEEDRAVGDAAQGLATAARKIEAEYRVPFLHHATMEPMGATVRVAEGRCEVWTGVQDPLNARRVAARLTGIDEEQVSVYNQQVGGSFGRRLPREFDFLEQAVQIAMELSPAPVKLIWSREEDTRHGFYRPAVTSRFEGAVDANGQVVAWQNLYTGAKEGRAAHPLYAIANQQIRHVPMQSHVREGPWRAVAFSHQGFFVEAFTDELAHAAGRDPYEFRRAGLADRPRHRAVLERVATLASWTSTQPVGPDPVDGLRRGRGIAIIESFGTIVAEVCDVAINAAGSVRVERVFAAVDCGIVVNPDTALAQIEGGILFGLSAALGEQITIEGGQIVQGNFHEYPLLRFPDSPPIIAEFVKSDEAPGGLGEPGTPPIAAALTNAVFAATGVRVRSLPLSSADLALKA